MGKLTAKKKLFTKEYIVDLNATQAAIRAGYSEKTAKSQGQRLLTNVDVAKEIQILFDARAERVELNSDYVVKRMQSIDEMDVIDILDDDLNIKPISEWPKTWRTTISGIDVTEIVGKDKEEKTLSLLKKIKWPDKLKNIEMLGRHFKLFTDKIEQDVSFTVIRKQYGNKK